MGMPFIGADVSGQVGPFSANASAAVGYGPGGEVMVDTGPAHISYAGAIFALLALKVFTESNLISDDPATIRMSLLNILQVSIMATVGIVGLKMLAAWALARGINIPGFADLMGAV